MLANLLKVILCGAIISCSIYSTTEFVPNAALIGVSIVATIFPLSIFWGAINPLTRIVGIGFFILSLLSLGLLMLAGSIGGSFHLSPSNKVIAIFLTAIVVISGTSFGWPANSEQKT